MNQQDNKVLEQLGLENLPDNEKKAVLAMIDQRLEKRFLANLLMSLDDAKKQELEGKIDEIEKPDVEDVIRISLDIQPDAAKILAQSANEVMAELKGETKKETPDEEKVEPSATPETTEPAESLAKSEEAEPTKEETKEPPAEDLPSTSASVSTTDAPPEAASEPTTESDDDELKITEQGEPLPASEPSEKQEAQDSEPEAREDDVKPETEDLKPETNSPAPSPQLQEPNPPARTTDVVQSGKQPLKPNTQSYDLDDTMRQASNKAGDYYQP